jgi:hypothetical protein
LAARTLPGDATSYPQVGSVCTDLDGDTFAIEGGECGPVDCNDSDASINPGAWEAGEDAAYAVFGTWGDMPVILR